MYLPRLFPAAIALAACLAAAQAEAASFAFDGNVVMNNDLVNIDFTVAGSAAPVALWTDSFRSGLNFDPQLTVWRQAGSDWQLVTSNDDNDTVGQGQSYQDAGLSVALASGAYKLTLSASSYQPVGTLLSQGFQFDPFFVPAITPTPIASWNQPSYDPNLNNQKGTFWSVHLDGTSLQAATVSAVPEPSTAILALLGLATLGVKASRRKI